MPGTEPIGHPASSLFMGFSGAAAAAAPSFCLFCVRTAYLCPCLLLRYIRLPSIPHSTAAHPTAASRAGASVPSRSSPPSSFPKSAPLTGLNILAARPFLSLTSNEIRSAD